MASSIKNLHLLLLPCSQNTRTEFAKFRKISSEPFRVACLCAAATTHYKWSIVDQTTAPSYHDPSTLFQIQDEPSMNYERKIVDAIKQLLQSNVENPIERLVWIDVMQRLGVSSYFEDDIQTILQQLYMDASSPGGLVLYASSPENTLRDFSLFFRLMRQHGYYISADAFKKFMGKDGRFSRKLGQDIEGLMELFEASQLSFEGEIILDEAAKFSSMILHERLDADDNLPDNLCRMVTNKLRHPYHKTIARLTEKDFFFKGYKRVITEWEKTLRELAMMDLHKGRRLYHEEMLQVSEWWNELGLAQKLKLSRNQPVKWYTWSMVSLIDDRSLSEQRVDLTKSIALIYLIDDIFDLYGSLDELTIFTEAVTRWDFDATEKLPDYMKMCYRVLHDTINEIGYRIYQNEGFNPINSLKASWASLCNAFLVEAKWLASGDLPTADVYLQNGKISSGIPVVLVQLFFSLGVGGTNGSAIHLKNKSQLISSVATILRLWDDLGSAKDEHQDGRDGSYIACYRRDNPGSSIPQAEKHVSDLITTEWKILNKECFLRQDDFSVSSFKRASLNFARMVPLMYSYDNNQRLPVLEEYVKFMLSGKTTKDTETKGIQTTEDTERKGKQTTNNSTI